MQRQRAAFCPSGSVCPTPPIVPSLLLVPTSSCNLDYCFGGSCTGHVLVEEKKHNNERDGVATHHRGERRLRVYSAEDPAECGADHPRHSFDRLHHAEETTQLPWTKADRGFQGPTTRAVMAVRIRVKLGFFATCSLSANFELIAVMAVFITPSEMTMGT